MYPAQLVLAFFSCFCIVVNYFQPYIPAVLHSNWNGQLNSASGHSVFPSTLLFRAEVSAYIGQLTPTCLYLSTQSDAEAFKFLLHLNNLLTFCLLCSEKLDTPKNSSTLFVVEVFQSPISWGKSTSIFKYMKSNLHCVCLLHNLVAFCLYS